MKPPAKPESGNVAQVAKLLNVTAPQVYNLVNSGVVPKPVNGQFDAAACAHGYIKYLQGRGGEDKRAYAEERTRLTKAQADKTEMELSLLRATTIPAAVVCTIWGRMTSAARARLLALPYRLAQAALSATEFAAIEAAASDLIAEALNELHEYSPSDYAPSAGRPQTGLAMEAAAETDGQPVGRSRKTAQSRIQRRAGPVEH